MTALSHFWASCDDLAKIPKDRLKRMFAQAALIGYSAKRGKTTKIQEVPHDQLTEMAWELEVLAAENTDKEE